MISPTIRNHAIYQRIKRKLIVLSRADMSPSVEQSLIDIECAVWFLELSIEEREYEMLRQLDVCADGADNSLDRNIDDCVHARNDSPVGAEF